MLTLNPPATRPLILSICLLSTFVACIGCSNAPPPILPPEWKPAEQAAAGMTLYDKNTDGKISGAELSPGLKAALKGIDTDGDKAISEAELTARIQGYADSKLGLLGVQGMVSYSGQLVPGAEVVFEPEPFLADVIKPATGTVGDDGYFIMQTEGQEISAVQPGLYIVRISKKDGAGNEGISNRFNTNTELGAEVGGPEDPQDRGAGQFDFKL